MCWDSSRQQLQGPLRHSSRCNRHQLHRQLHCWRQVERHWQLHRWLFKAIQQCSSAQQLGFEAFDTAMPQQVAGICLTYPFQPLHGMYGTSSCLGNTTQSERQVSVGWLKAKGSTAVVCAVVFPCSCAENLQQSAGCHDRHHQPDLRLGG